MILCQMWPAGYFIIILCAAIPELGTALTGIFPGNLPGIWLLIPSMTVLLGMPSAFFFIALGLLCGSIFNDKQVGGICGALLTNLAAWLSGTWFDLELVGGTFQKIADALPFVHAVELERAVIEGDFSGILPHLWWVLGYAAATGAAAIFVFTHKMKHN